VLQCGEVRKAWESVHQLLFRWNCPTGLEKLRKHFQSLPALGALQPRNPGPGGPDRRGGFGESIASAATRFTACFRPGNISRVLPVDDEGESGYVPLTGRSYDPSALDSSRSWVSPLEVQSRSFHQEEEEKERLPLGTGNTSHRVRWEEVISDGAFVMYRVYLDGRITPPQFAPPVYRYGGSIGTAYASVSG